MTEITRIRWTGERADTDPAFTGSVGTVDPCLFQIYAPDGFAPQWILTTSFPGMEDKRSYADDPDELKAEAERWQEEFVSSLGAVFPDEPAILAGVFDEERFRAQHAPGCYVRYTHPDAGWPGEQEKARELLTPGGIYGIAWSEIGQSKTSLGLVGIDGTFNSVLFEPVEPRDPRPHDRREGG